MSSNTLIEVFGHVVFSFTRTHCFETFSFSLDWASKAEKMDINCIEFAENAVSLLRKHFQYGCTFTSQVYIHLKDRSYWERLRFVSKF